MTNTLTEMFGLLCRQSWQIAIVFAVVAAGCLILRRASAHWRYLLWLVVVVKCFVPPLVTVPVAILPASAPELTGQPYEAEPVWHGTGYVEPLPSAGAIEASEATPTPTAAYPIETPAPVGAETSQPLVPELSLGQWISVVWMAGAIGFWLYALLRAGTIGRRLRRCRRQADAQLQSLVGQLAGKLGLARPPEVWLVDGYSQPFVWGLLNGAVYLPADFAQTGSSEDRTNVLAHELAHVLRRDAAINALQVVAGGLFWFHPLVWWANKKIRQEREKCCDEVAIAALDAAPRDYGSAIVDVLISDRHAGKVIPSLAVAGPARNVEERIRTIMSKRNFERRPSGLAVVVAVLLALLTIPASFAVTAKTSDSAQDKETSGSSKGQYVATFPDGSVVEIVALCDHPSQGKQWWAPNGTPLKRKFETSGCKARPGPVVRPVELVFRLGPASEDVFLTWKCQPSGTGGSLKVAGTGKLSGKLRGLVNSVPVDRKSMGLRIGAAAGPWQTRVAHQGSGTASYGRVDGGFAFTSALQSSGDTIISASDDIQEDVERRISAVLKDGREVAPFSKDVVSAGKARLMTATFKDISPQQISEFRLQARPYIWVEFRNLSLRPGQKTEVHIIENRPGASAEIFPGVMRRYAGKTVSDFPERVDLSSPETSWAAWHRATGRRNANALAALSWVKLDPESIERSWEGGDPEDLRIYHEAVLASKLLEVLTYHGDLAKTISYLPFRPGKGRQPYSLRSFGKIGGQWRNLGEDRCASLEEARETFNRKKDRLWDNFQRIARDYTSAPTGGD